MEPRILIWDLETTDLEMDFGTILCAGYRWHDEPPKHSRLFSIRDYPLLFKKDQTDDSALVKDFYKVLAKADVWVTWYGERFDQRGFNSKLMEHNLSPLPHIQHVDLWRTAKYKMKLSSNRLKNVCAYLDLPEKTPVLGKIWRRARTGHGPSIEYVETHCQQDVWVLDLAYRRMAPWVSKHPHLGLIAGRLDACPTCGVSGQLTKQGERASRTRVYQQFLCKHCGSWCRSRLSEKGRSPTYV